MTRTLYIFAPRTLTTLFGLTVALLLTASGALAQSQRTFVSTSGSDSNTASLCSAASPCRGFNAALSVTTVGGEIVALSSGGYGAVTITKSVQITAPTGVYAAITQIGAGDAVTINATATDTIVLRGLTLNGINNATDGIDFNTGAALYVENCVINGFGDTGIKFEGAGKLFVKGTVVRHNSFGIVVAASSGTANATIDRTRLINNLNHGVYVLNNGQATISNTVASGNTNGYLATGSAARMSLVRTSAVNNTNIGVIAESGADVTCEECVARGNPSYGFLSIGALAVMRVANSMAISNDYGFGQSQSGVFETRGNNMVRGNTSGATLGTITLINSN